MIYFENRKAVVEFIETITNGTGIRAKVVKVGDRYAIRINA